MRPSTPERTVSTNAVNTDKFGISFNDQAHILSILRDRLYTNKIMAVLREYSTNAWDAHIEAGKKEVPFKVTLPTHMEPTLCIRDYGLGLSEEQVFTVYTKYGASTKRNSNETAGMLGIGAKSAFAYSEAFTVTSWNGGKKTVYVAVLDETNVGQMNKSFEQDLADPTETGVEIKVPIDPSDVEEFRTEATQLFTWFDVRPTLNVDLEFPEFGEQFKSEHGVIFLNGNDEAMYGGWLGRMGCVAYRVNFDRVSARPEFEPYLKLIQKMKYGCLMFEIGEVDVSANREELEYTERTKVAIIRKLGQLNDSISAQAYAKLSTLGNVWERRLEVRTLQDRLPFGIPQEYSGLGRLEVQLVIAEVDKTEGSPTLGKMVSNVSTFELKKFEWVTERVNERSRKVIQVKETSSIRVDKMSRLIIVDDKKLPLKRYLLAEGIDRLIMPKIGFSIAAVQAELAEAIKRVDIEGISVVLLSTLQVRPQEESKKVATRPHYKHGIFRWNEEYDNDRASDNWELIDKWPDDEPIFILISGFEPHGDYAYTLRDVYNFTRCVAALTGEVGFELYGVKTTAKKPVTEEEVDGIPFAAWRASKIKQLQDTPDLVAKLNTVHHSEKHAHYINKLLQYAGYSTERGLPAMPFKAEAYLNEDGDETQVGAALSANPLTLLDQTLPEEHPIMQFFVSCLEAYRHTQLDPLTPHKAALTLLSEIVPWVDPLEDLYDRYPLLGAQNRRGQPLNRSIEGLLSPEVPAYLQYVLAIDKYLGG